MPILTRRCCKCDERYELLEMRGEVTALDRDDIDDLTCPACGSAEYEGIVGAAVGKAAGLGGCREYPYRDRALGCVVRDVAHHRWLLTHHPDGRERETKLRPTEGEVDFAAWADKDRDEAAAAKHAHDEYVREMSEGPSKAEWAKLQEHLARKVADEQAKQRGYNHEVEVRWPTKR